jgi:NTP pyrophosphatase (non-canonical NTP hydrolase)
MSRTEHLLVIMIEECAEVAQRATKALRFTLDEVQPGQDKTNKQRLLDELTDLMAVVEMCVADDLLPDRPSADVAAAMEEKKRRVETFLKYSKEMGTLDE